MEPTREQHGPCPNCGEQGYFQCNSKGMKTFGCDACETYLLLKPEGSNESDAGYLERVRNLISIQDREMTNPKDEEKDSYHSEFERISRVHDDLEMRGPRLDRRCEELDKIKAEIQAKTKYLPAQKRREFSELQEYGGSLAVIKECADMYERKANVLIEKGDQYIVDRKALNKDIEAFNDDMDTWSEDVVAFHAWQEQLSQEGQPLH